MQNFYYKKIRSFEQMLLTAASKSPTKRIQQFHWTPFNIILWIRLNAFGLAVKYC